MSALLLSAVSCSWGESGVALSANHLVTVVLSGQNLERRLDSTTTETKNEMEGRLLLDVVIAEGSAILELLTGKDESLLIRGNSLLILNLGLYVIDSIGGLDIKGDGLTSEGLNEDLHVKKQN